MKRFKLKYLLGAIIMGVISVLIVCNPEKYNFGLIIPFATLFCFSIVLLIQDTKDE
jgi:drug/metabolite transporter (DMT)-like permease